MAEQDPDNKDLVVVSPANHLILKSYMYLTSKNVHCCVLLNKPYD